MEGLTSSFGLSFYCSVCKSECESYADWISHLVDNEHQKLARIECRKWDESVKECVVVAYADFPIIEFGRRIVQVFGCLSRGRFLTDFVTWEHRPKVAFIQFESRKKAWEVIPKSSRMSQMKIQNRRVQVKKAIDIMELEWFEFFPVQQPTSRKQLKNSSVQAKTLSNPTTLKKRKLSVDIDGHGGDNSNPKERTPNYLPCLLKSLFGDSPNSDPEERTSNPVPSSVQIVLQKEKPHISTDLPPPPSFNNITCNRNHSIPVNETISITLMSSKGDPSNNSKNKIAAIVKFLPPPLLSKNDITDNLEGSTKNPVHTVKRLPQNDCSNNSTPEDGKRSPLPSSSSMLPPCKVNDIVSSNPKPTFENKKLPNQENFNKSKADKRSGSSNNILPSLLELPLEKPPGLRQTNKKRQKLISPEVSIIITTPNNFQTQYKEIFKEIMFSDLEYNNVMSIVKSMELCIQETYPKSKLYVFRNIYLKLKNPGSNKLLIFLDTQGIWTEDRILENSSTSDNIPFMCPDLKKPVQDLANKLKVKKVSDVESNTQDFIPELDSFGIEFRHEENDLSFYLVTRQHFILELQTCRLLNYMTAFDPRTFSIMAVVKYWGNVNRVVPISPEEIADKEALPSIFNQAVSLEWLIIVFLSSRRSIPTVRQVLERPHKKLVMFNQDIGFDEDMTFAKAWTAKRGFPGVGSEGFIESVLALVQEFFKFCSQLPCAPFVLNTRDGEIIKLEQLSKPVPYCHSAVSCVTTKLSTAELISIRNQNTQIKYSQKTAKCYLLWKL